MIGEAFGRIHWEKVVGALLPNNVEKVILLIERGRCFDADERTEAINILLGKVPTMDLVQFLSQLSSSRHIGARPLLKAICHEWAKMDPARSRKFAATIQNPVVRTEMLKSMLAAAADIGSPDWTAAIATLSESAWEEPVMALARGLDVGAALKWIETNAPNLAKSRRKMLPCSR